jgi:hypothetical protein
MYFSPMGKIGPGGQIAILVSPLFLISSAGLVSGSTVVTSTCPWELAIPKAIFLIEHFCVPCCCNSFLQLPKTVTKKRGLYNSNEFYDYFWRFAPIFAGNNWRFSLKINEPCFYIK